MLDVSLKPGHSRDAILFIGGLPIFSAAYYAKVAFDEVSLEPPLGSGSYKLGDFQQGRFVEMERVADYWGKDLPINVGTGNFGKLRFEYYADRKIAFEGFKAGDFTFREEFTASVWATQYGFPAVLDGRVKKELIKDETPNGTQGWFFNTRRDKFKDPRIRQAIGTAFDFKWTNAHIMYDAYQRTVSYFQNSPMAATGAPSPEELALLEPFRAKLPPEVFGPVVMPPESDGSGTDRALLRKGFELLKAAGCKRQGEQLMLADGTPLTIEFLESDPALDPHTLPFIPQPSVARHPGDDPRGRPGAVQAAHRQVRFRRRHAALRIRLHARRIDCATPSAARRRRRRARAISAASAIRRSTP